jgi:hypothetical protein
MEPILGTDKLPAARLALTCGVCRQQHGACIQCAGSGKCYAAFHATCAREAGYRMGVQGGDAPDADDGDLSDANDLGSDGAEGERAAGVGANQQQQQQQRKKKKGRTAKGGCSKKRSEGTSAGALCRLLCFCPKHKNVKLPGGAVVAIHASNTGAAAPTPTRIAAAAAAAVGGARPGGGHGAASPLPFGLMGPSGGSGAAGGGGAARQRLEMGGGAGAAAGSMSLSQQQQLHNQQQQHRQIVLPPGTVLSPGRAAALAAVAAHMPPAGTCARSRAADAALRRGPRAPEAVEAGLRKRLYVRRLPYLVTHRPPRPGRPLLPPPERAARAAGPEFDAVSSGVTGAALLALSSAAGGGAGAAHSQQQPTQPPAAPRILSQAERFARMVATTPDRVAAGKSAIHGWGAFAKAPHRAGDMVVEYAGSLVRPSVADTLERRHYNKFVGAGEQGGWLGGLVDCFWGLRFGSGWVAAALKFPDWTRRSTIRPPNH